MLLDQLPTGGAEQHHRRATLAHQEAEQLEQGRLRPMDVVNEDHERTV